MAKADIPEIIRAEHDSASGNKNVNLYYWNTQTLAWAKVFGDNGGIKINLTLQDAYNGGNTITTAGGLAPTITVPIGSGNAGLIINQNDTTNNPSALRINNATSGDSIQVRVTGTGLAFGAFDPSNNDMIGMGHAMTTFNALPLRGQIIYDSAGAQATVNGVADLGGSNFASVHITRQVSGMLGAINAVTDDTGNTVSSFDTFDGIVLGSDNTDTAGVGSRGIKVFKGDGLGGLRFLVDGATGNTTISSSSTTLPHLSISTGIVFTGTTTNSLISVRSSNVATSGTLLYIESASGGSAADPMAYFINSSTAFDQATVFIDAYGTSASSALRVQHNNSGKALDVLTFGNSGANPSNLFTDSSAGSGATIRINRTAGTGDLLHFLNPAATGRNIFMQSGATAAAWIDLKEGSNAHTGSTTDAMVSIGMDTVTSSGTALFVRSAANASASNPAVHFITTSSANDQAVLKITQANTSGVSAHLDTGHLQLGTLVNIIGADSNELLIFTQTASAVNELTLGNAATGNNVTLSATGGDTNIGITLTNKGSGQSQTNNFRITGGGSYPSWGANGVGFSIAAATYTDTTSTGSPTDIGIYSFRTPTFAATNVITPARVATVYIENSPTAGTNVTTNDFYALWVDNGFTRLDGNVCIGGNPAGAAKLRFSTNLSSTGVVGTNGSAIWIDSYVHTNSGATGTIATWVANGFNGLTVGRNSSNTPTYTDCANIYVTPNIAGTGVTLTNNWAIWSTGNMRIDGRMVLGKGADVASASGLTLGEDGNLFNITGTTTINTITATRWRAGSVIILHFTGALTVTHNSGGTNDIMLSGSANFATAANSRLQLYFDGTDWWEISRTLA